MIRHATKTILYVDDTVEQRYAMRRILEKEGFSVIEAGSGREAMHSMAKEPSLAVVDVRLPDIDGFELTRRIKGHTPHLPVLQVSASFSNPVLRASGLSGGADAYIAQPVHPAELVALIQSMLQTWETEETLRFLAGIGSQLNETLLLKEALGNICRAMVPAFADCCLLHVQDQEGAEDPICHGVATVSALHREELEQAAQKRRVKLLDSRAIVVSLHMQKRVLGSIGFFLNEDREYTASDLVLAADLASRASLAIQNCLLMASEQATREALIQSEKIATAGRLSAAIAHEINNPLEALTNLIYLLEHSPESTAYVREIAGTALAEISRVAHITRQTLGFYRELSTPVEMSLAQSARETLSLFQPRLNTRRIGGTHTLDDAVTISGIRGEIRQLISNLVVNAIDVLDDGGSISVAVFRDTAEAVLQVTDNGPGIPPSVLPKIFEAFYTTKQGTGTGLGLWITHSIVEKHKGSIKVFTDHSEANHGTTFEVRFPAFPQA